MPRFDFDLSDVKDTREVLPAGTYHVMVEDMTGEVARTGNPQLKFVWKIIDGEHMGRTQWDFAVLLPNTLWKIKRIMKALEIPNDHADIDTDNKMLNGYDVLGRTCYIVTRIGKNQNGEERAEVTNWIPTTEIGNEGPSF